MGKVRTRFIGLEDLEQQQKEEQKRRAAEKKTQQSDVSDEPIEKPKKAGKSAAASLSRKKAHGKKWQKAAKKVDDNKVYELAEAIALIKEMKYTSFDESVELHLNLTKKGLKGEVELPHSTGKRTRVAIVDDALLEKIEKGEFEFDILVSHPSFMPKLAKHARILGPKGLMPNPKTGTVTPNPEEVAKKFEKGALQWKSESKFPLLHIMIAKLSADSKEIEENAVAFMQTVGKSTVQQAFIKGSMTPAVEIDLQKIFV